MIRNRASGTENQAETVTDADVIDFIILGDPAQMRDYDVFEILRKFFRKDFKCVLDVV